MMSGSSSVAVEPLDSLEFLSVLSSFRDILSTCRGPKARVKILVSSGGISTVTSSSKRLLSNLVLTNPVCVMISQVMKSQIATYGDYGLYCGVVTCSLMREILSQDRISYSFSCSLMQHLSSVMVSLLQLNCIKLSLNFISVKELLSVIQPILSSKPACGLHQTELSTLSINTAKAFLKTVDEEVGEIVVLDGGACEEQSVVFQGVLYQLVAENSIIDNLNQKFMNSNCEIPLLLFNVMLTEDDSSGNRRDAGTILVDINSGSDVVRNALCMLEQAVELNVGIVACQKVVHGSIHTFLQRNNILLLDRMGTELTRLVEKLSGAKPLSNVHEISSSDLETCLGHVQSVKVVKQNKKQFVLLEKDHNVATMLLFAPNEEAGLELKVVTEQALQSLRQLVYLPYVTPGAGCSEACLAVLLQLKLLSTQNTLPFKPEQIKLAVGWLQRSLLFTAGYSQTAATSLSVDSVFYHLWEQKTFCCCRLVSARQVEDHDGQWIELNSFSIGDLLIPYSYVLPEEPKTPVGPYKDAVLDVYSSKYNALNLALETCQHLLSIGVIIYKQPA